MDKEKVIGIKKYNLNKYLKKDYFGGDYEEGANNFLFYNNLRDIKIDKEDLIIDYRENLENDLSVVHFIVYYPIIINETKNKFEQLFIYQRTNKVHDKRLSGLWSCGIGGHVNETDYHEYLNSEKSESQDISLSKLLDIALKRELDEEVDFSDMGDITKVVKTYSVILDETSDVGKVHIGFTGKIVLKINDQLSEKHQPEFNLILKETELDNGVFIDASDLISSQRHLRYNFEKWSENIINNIIDDKRRRVHTMDKLWDESIS